MSEINTKRGQVPLEAARARSVPLPLTGQAMILTILALGGVILGSTAVAGMLMLFQLRQATDIANSAKAIFAADAGIERGLYIVVKTPGVCPGACSLEETLGNGARYEAQIDTSQGTVLSRGIAGTARRAFFYYAPAIGVP